ncbi:MarR family winged helix-turn-helix transcriptional regulator [Fodinicola acaciae]|uniref:MarR family winged helix-turn-helix transcriptional regulator n=1 Tax=Fodinicola acaciae TaxID=2681555 RepID=UPI0013D7A0E1|nr:MarR family transcriptional regulator [Fodinicola acaciae]
MTDVRWLTGQEQRAWRGYRRMRALLDLQISRDLAKDGLSDADYDVLSTLSETEQRRMRITELASRMRWSTSRLSHHISRMQQRGLVVREESASDGRGAVAVLTDDGWTTVEAAARGHVRSVREHFIDLLTAEELRTLTAVTEKIIDRLSPSRDAKM